MLKISVLLALLIITGCANNRGSNGVSCEVEKQENGVLISCPNSDVYIPYPSDDPEEVVDCTWHKHKHHWHRKCS